jgi:hypothetical protein
MKKIFIIVLLVVFALITGVSYWLHQYDPGFNFTVLMVANGLLFIVALLAHMMAVKSMNGRPQAFVRGVFSGTILKLFVCMAAVLIYAVTNRGHIYKPLVFAFFGIYILYSVAETWMSRKLAKKDS